MFTRVFLFLALCLAHVSCTSTDPDYERLVAQADTNVSPQAIVGMWHRKAAPEVPVVTGKLRMSLLFSRDGTGAADAWVHNGIYFEPLRSETGSFTWTYAGHGVWNMQLHSKGGRVDECRMSGGKLLREYNRSTSHLVYERVNP
jgi:hypothetical protein